MSSITCSCGDALTAIKNDPCNFAGIGVQITAIAYQLMTGSDFNGTAITGTEGGDISLEADWQAKMAAVDEDKIVLLNNLGGVQTPEGTPQVRENNDVAYGGRVITDIARAITGRLDFPSFTDIQAVSRVNKCVGKVRVWLLDNNYFLQGPVLNANITFGSLIRPGLGQPLPAHIPFSLNYNAIEEPEFQATALPFISTLVNP